GAVALGVLAHSGGLDRPERGDAGGRVSADGASAGAFALAGGASRRAALEPPPAGGTLRALSNRGRRAEGGATPAQEKEQVGGPAAQRRWGSSLPRRRGPVQRAVRRGGARCTGPGRVGDSPSLGRGPVPGLAAKRAGRFSG